MTRHLYVHLPFCAHRCGYCDFVTAVGRQEQHAPYVDALLSELELEQELLAPELETVFLGGGTPTFTEPHALERLLASLPQAEEVTVEANPETVTQELARRLRAHGVNRVSLGVQSFRPRLLRVLDRVVQPDTVRRAFYHLRDAGFDNISFDLIYGIPGQSAPTSTPTWRTHSSSAPSTCRATSSKRSPERASPTPTATSSRARRTRWRPTSRSSSTG